MKKKTLIIILICICLIVLGILSFTVLKEKYGMADKSKEAEEAAKQLLESIYTIQEEEYEEFMSITDEESLTIWMSERYGSYMTQQGLEKAMQNRESARGISLYREHEYIPVIEAVTLTEREDIAQGKWYDYEVKLRLLEDTEVVDKGLLQMVLENEAWKAEQIRRER